MQADQSRYRQAGIALCVVGPDNKERFARFFRRHDLACDGVPDPEHAVAGLYDQQVRRLIGRMPTIVLVDGDGMLRGAWDGASPRDYPSTDEILAALKQAGE